MHIQKVILSPELLLSSTPPFKLKYSARTIGLRGNDDTAKCLNLCFQSYKSIDSMKERRHTGTSTDEPLQMDLYR